MPDTKTDILNRLQKEIFSLQGFRQVPGTTATRFGLGPIENAFPNKCFPLAAMHEFISNDAGCKAATSGFISGIVSTLMQSGRASIWINPVQTVFPPALKLFGIDPDKIIFITIQKPTEMLWVMEEALKCEGLAAVIGEIPEINFTASRRLQLAVEQSRVTGFIIRNQPRTTNVNACVARWKISPLRSETKDQLPGIGFPRWNIELLKIRNGKPGAWQMEWSDGFHNITATETILPSLYKRKVV